MAERAIDRVTRLLGIVAAVERDGEASFEALAQRFGVSADRIREDVELLWVSGVPGHGPEDLIDFDAWAFEEGVVRLTNSQGVTQVRLSPREAVALIGALSAIVAGGAASEPVTEALAKLSDAVGDGVAVRTVPTATVDPDVLAQVRAGVEAKRALTFTYVDAQDRRTERLIEPHRLVVIDGVAYVECFCHRAGDYRTLRLTRIEAVRTTDQPVTSPPHATGGFALEPAFEATIVAARRARWLLEGLPGAELTDRDDEVEARVGVAGAAGVASQLLSIAPHLRSVEPQSLRGELARQAHAVLAAQE